MESSGVKHTGKPESESQAINSTYSGTTRSNPGGGSRCSVFGLLLRVLLLLTSVAAVVVMGTAKQTELVMNPFTRTWISRPAKFSHSPAFIYFIAALALSALYSAISILTLLLKKCHFSVAILDALLLGIVASATGAAAGVAYIGLKGNKYVGWLKVCSVYDKFCKHVASSVLLSLIASIVLLLLVMLNTYSAHRQSQNRH